MGQLSNTARVVVIALICALSAVIHADRAAAQTEWTGPYLAGFRNVQFRNSYPGSAAIPCRVTYPASLAGFGTPVLQSLFGFPVVLFAHGTNHTSAHYTQIADHLATWGFIVVAHDTHPRDRLAQIKDLEALAKIVVDEDTDPTSFLFGAVNEARIGIAGHSMGGGSVAGVLASTPSIRAGVLLAPSDTPAPNAANWMTSATAPFLVLCGAGDRITPFSSNALKFYQKGASVSTMRALLRFWAGCDHFAVAYTTSRSTPDNRIAFSLSRRYCTAFLLATLADQPAYFDYLVGSSGRNEPKLDLAMVEVRSPWLYITGEARPGGVMGFHLMGRAQGPGIVALSPYLRPRPLFEWGTLHLSTGALFFAYGGQLPTDGVLHQALFLPDWPALRGLTVHWQGLAETANRALRLTTLQSTSIR